MIYGEHLKNYKHLQNHLDVNLIIVKIRQSIVLNPFSRKYHIKSQYFENLIYKIIELLEFSGYST